VKSHHTISITIPTKLILYVAAGALIGAAAGVALAYLTVIGVELWAPMLGLPMAAAAKPVAVRAAQAPAQAPEAWTAPIAFPKLHPAVRAFDAVPLPVAVALGDLVDRVLAEKYRNAA